MIRYILLVVVVPDYAGLVGAYFIEKYADKEVITCFASEFRYKKLFLKRE